jgi:hypothetical protein
MMEKLDGQYWQEITLEEASSREWSDVGKDDPIVNPPQDPMKPLYEYPKYSEERMKDAVEYPYKPYYKEGEAFICAEHGYGTKSFDEFMSHMLKYHPDDFEAWLKHHVGEGLKHRIRYKYGSSEHLSPEILSRLVEAELKEIMLTTELTQENNLEAFSGYADRSFSEMRDFLTGKTNICPLCHKDMEYHTEDNAYLSKKIIDSLKAGMTTLSREDEKYYYKVVKRKYPAKWRAEDIDLCLRNTLHMHLTHGRIESLVKAKILSGALPEWLASKGYEDKQTKMNLSSLFPDSQDSPSDKNTTKSEKILKRWLEGK